MPIAHFNAFALDCPDPLILAGFYQGIIGGEIPEEESDDWVELRLVGSTTLAFQRVDDYTAPQWPDGNPQQAHIDLDVPDLDVAEAAIVALGARKADFQPHPDSFRVFLDPVGHPFCLVKGSSGAT
ncbi:MAG: VOC family protein [bacterium]|nr:VOC family protein [bacterium]